MRISDWSSDVCSSDLGASAWARWTSARERRQLIENTLLPQADATWQSALASYQVGEVDFGTLLEALNEWQGADLARVDRSEEHTSELQSLMRISYAVFCLKKKKNTNE